MHQLQLLVQAVRKSLDDHASDLAAGIAFWALFSIFPLLLGIFALAGFFLDASEAQERIFEMMEGLIPGTTELIQSNLDSVIRYRSGMGTAGVLGLLWTASKGLAAVTRAVNLAIGSKPSHSYVVSKLQFFAMTVAVAVLFTASVSLTVALEVFVKSSLLSRLGLEPIEMPRLQNWSVSFFFVFLMLALIYKITPYERTRWRQVVPGALLAAALFGLGQAGFVFYLDRMAGLEAIYGSLTSILVLLLWLYFSAFILVFGAEYNIVRWRAGTDVT